MTGPELPPIYTKTGDDGTTGQLFGGRLSKADPIVEICGTLDEAVAALGLARATLTENGLAEIALGIQRGLFVLAADVSANPRAREALVPGVSAATPEMTAALETSIDSLLAGHPLQPVFLVPGATLPSAALDLARTSVRRAERRAVAARESGTAITIPVLTYLNRASDLLYVLARRAAGDAEEPRSHD
jgi:cob(I)alamin adenosyltransferase